MTETATNGFRRSLHVERDVEDQLVADCRDWFNGKKSSGWIALKSASGRGNTWLLHSLVQKISEEFVLRYLARAFLVESEGVAAAPRALTPLQEAFTRPLRTRFVRAQEVLRLALRPGLLSAAVALFVGVMLINGAGNYFPDHPEGTLRSFLFDYLPPTLPVYFVLGIAAAILGMAGKFLEKSFLQQEDDFTVAERKNLVNSEGMVDGLRRLAGGRRCLFVAIDDAHLLPPVDRTFLQECLNGGMNDPAIAAFLRTHRIFFIVLDQVDGWLSVPPVRSRQIEAVTDAQLFEIARRHRPEIYEQLKNDDPAARNRLDEARANIHALVSESAAIQALAGEAYTAAMQSNPAPDSVFAAEGLLLFQAVRVVAGIGSATPQKEQIRAWLTHARTVTLLADLGMAAPQNVLALLGELHGRSPISRFVDKQVVFDVTRCRALAEWARKNRPEDAARAYYFWLAEVLAEAEAVDVEKIFRTVPPVRHRNAIKKAAWLAVEIGEDGMKPETLLGRFADPARAADGRRQIVRALVLAAVIYSREGDTTLAIVCAKKAIEWIDAAFVATSADVVDALAALAWELLWLTADPAVQELLDTLAGSIPGIVESRVWQMESRFRDFAMGRKVVKWQSGRKKLRPVLFDRAQLAEAYRATREARGLLFVRGGRFEYPEIGAPAGAEFPQTPATSLRLLAVLAALDKGDDATALVDSWSTNMRAGVAASCVGDEALLAFDRAALAHARVESLWPQRAGEDPEHDEAFRESAAAYERTLVLASLLGWRGLAAEASFHFAMLLYARHVPGAAPTLEEETLWQERIETTLDIESSAGWHLLTPDIWLLRWVATRSLAVEASLEAGWNALEAARDAGFPRQLIIQWTQTLSGDVTKTSNAPLRFIQVFDWRIEQFEWPERAGEPRNRPTNELETADQHAYAAQTYRQNGRIDEAMERLDRATAILAAIPPSEDPKIEDARRDVSLHVKYQRLHVHVATENIVEYNQIVMEMWREVHFEDEMFSHVLGLVTTREMQMRRLEEPWPLSEGSPAADPDAPQLSVPFETGPVEPLTRLDYRVLQLVHCIRITPRMTFDQATAIRQLARIALENTSAGRGRSFATLVEYLDRARYHAAVTHLELSEIEALRLLFVATKEESYRDEYVAAMSAYDDLIEREKQLALRTPLGWYQLAERIHEQLQVLVDDALLESQFVRAAAARGLDPAEVAAESRARIEAYTRAFTAFEEKRREQCAAELDASLPGNDVPWVFWDDLYALNQWLICTDSDERPIEEVNAREQQLRVFTVRYVQQCAQTIPDEGGHLLAMKLQRIVEETLRKSTHLTVSAERELFQGSGGRGFDPERLRLIVERFQ